MSKKEKEKNREKDYEYALKFRREYHSRVLFLANLWNVAIMTEDDLPNWRKNVMKCEDNSGAFNELKQGKFFLSLDQERINKRLRIEAIHKTLITLEECH